MSIYPESRSSIHAEGGAELRSDFVEKLYPEIVSEEEVNKMIDVKLEKSNKEINKERLDKMLKEIKRLEELKQRYERVKNSWGKSDSIIKVISSLIGLTTVCSFIVINVIGGVGLIPLISLTIIDCVIAGMGGLSAFVSTMISMRWTKRKKKEFRARIKLIEEYLNKFFYHIQKAKRDEIITIEELKQFDELLAEFNNKLLELKFKQTKKDYNMISSMSQPGTFNSAASRMTDSAVAKAKEAPVRRMSGTASVGTSLITEKEIKKINKEVQQQIKQEVLFNARQEALFNAKKNLQLGMTEVILREEQEQK